MAYVFQVFMNIYFMSNCICKARLVEYKFII